MDVKQTFTCEFESHWVPHSYGLEKSLVNYYYSNGRRTLHIANAPVRLQLQLPNSANLTFNLEKYTINFNDLI